jgi:hypothetical protein
MDTIRRREFHGSWLWFAVLCLTGVGIPFAVIYLIENTVEIETQVKDGESAWEKIRERKR